MKRSKALVLINILIGTYILMGFLMFPTPVDADFLAPNCTPASCPYVFLAPLPFIAGGAATTDVAKDGANTYLVGLYTAGIALASALAMIMIVIGGAQYASSDAIQGKSDGKQRIQAAVAGLVLALLSFTILRTINVNLVSVNFSPAEIEVNTTGGTPAVVVVPPGGTPPAGGGTQVPGGVVNGSEAMRLDTTARGMVGQTTCNISGTGNGRLACAYVVNDIVNDALGKPLTGSTDNEASFGRATAEMYDALKASDKFYYVGSSISALRPGDIIISPTQGNNIGHVGVYTSTGKIVSNSSSRTQVDDNHTPQGWANYYTGKGLGLYVYRAGTPNAPAQ